MSGILKKRLGNFALVATSRHHGPRELCKRLKLGARMLVRSVLKPFKRFRRRFIVSRGRLFRRRLGTMAETHSEEQSGEKDSTMDLDDESCNQILLVPAEEIRQRLSKYGASREPPQDNSVVCPSDDHFAFCARGREFENASTNHRYTSQERQMLAAYESLEYLPPDSKVYKTWLKKDPPHTVWQQLLMNCLIGLAVGLIGALLHQTIDLISDFKWLWAKQYLEEYTQGTGSMVMVWFWVACFSSVLVFFSAGLVVFLRPQAASSGIPELMGFLNGTVVRHIFNIKTLIIKFLSCILCVAAGMPVGPEGPMIHIGSLVGAGLSQFKSDTMKFKLPCFEQFRNFEDRRNFISAGAAAGVASAFGAPVGGLLFSMEEVSSFWNLRLSWSIFCCAMVASFTTALFNSAFSGFQYQGSFGAFKSEEYILFKVQNGFSINILTFIPAVILGVIGGLTGALFTFINLKIVKTRRNVIDRLRRKWVKNIVRLGEPILIMIIMASASVYLPSLFSCSPFKCIQQGDETSDNCLNSTVNPLHIDVDVEGYTCPSDYSTVSRVNYTWTNRTYNQMGTLLFGSTEGAIHQLFSRSTHIQLGYIPLLSVFIFYFLMAAWASGTSISSGILVPMLFIGGLYGRFVGIIMVSMFGIHSAPNSYWLWMDPGAFALVGAASFFGGVSRLTISLAVIMIEMTNDVQFLLPIMAAIMVSKWVGDYFTHSYYLALMELKCIPYLDAEPVVNCNGKKVSLELHCAADIMSSPPVVVHVRESIVYLADILLNTNHGGFPVVRKSTNGEEVFFGYINRLQLAVLLKYPDLFTNHVDADVDFSPIITHPQLTLDKLEHPQIIEEMLFRYVQNDEFKDLFINLEPYVNQSAFSVPDKFSLERTYITFRTMGLRHMAVVDENNHVIGVITRKDLMGFNMEEKLALKISRTQSQEDLMVILED